MLENKIEPNTKWEISILVRSNSKNSRSLSKTIIYLQLSDGKGQIISFGAGFDTLYWKLKDAGKNVENFVELDFPSVTAKKCYHIKKHKQLIDWLNTEGNTRSIEMHLMPNNGTL